MIDGKKKYCPLKQDWDKTDEEEKIHQAIEFELNWKFFSFSSQLHFHIFLVVWRSKKDSIIIISSSNALYVTNAAYIVLLSNYNDCAMSSKPVPFPWPFALHVCINTATVCGVNWVIKLVHRACNINHHVRIRISAAARYLMYVQYNTDR